MILGTDGSGAGAVDGVGARWPGGEKPPSGERRSRESKNKDKANQVDKRLKREERECPAGSGSNTGKLVVSVATANENWCLEAREPENGRLQVLLVS